MNLQRIERVSRLGLGMLLLTGFFALLLAGNATYRNPAVASVVEAGPLAALSLLAMIAVLGPGRWFLRIPFAAILAGGVIWLGFEQTDLALFPQLMIVLLFQFGGLAVSLPLVRWVGGPVRLIGPLERTTCGKFSIFGLLLVTGISAVLIALAKWLREYFAAESLTNPWLAGGGMGVCFLLITLLAVWNVLRRRAGWLHGAAYLVLSVGCGLLPIYLCSREQTWQSILPLILAYAFLVGGGACLVLRIAGYAQAPVIKSVLPVTEKIASGASPAAAVVRCPAFATSESTT